MKKLVVGLLMALSTCSVQAFEQKDLAFEDRQGHCHPHGNRDDGYRVTINTETTTVGDLEGLMEQTLQMPRRNFTFLDTKGKILEDPKALVRNVFDMSIVADHAHFHGVIVCSPD